MNRLRFLLIYCLTWPYLCGYSQKVVVCNTSPQWESGKFNKLSITITFPSVSGFARFTQDIPEGIDIVPDIVTHGDFSFNGRQVNVVWLTIPDKGAVTFSYLANPDKSMNGSFELGGKLIYIKDGKQRNEYFMDTLIIKVAGVSGNSSAEKSPLKSAAGAVTQKPVPEKQVIPSRQEEDLQAEFRVQLAVSAKPLTPAQVAQKLGLESAGQVKMVKDGNVYKYQAGSCFSYSEASSLLKKYIASGIKDAFIVAYKGDKQVPVDDNLKKRQP